MARKAVQGYPEKSFYDNTRYLGMIATTDPLQEGFFKHIVNFDISDTGQSVQPRDGFITTTLYDGVSVAKDHISLSNKTIVFKSANDSAYIFYDFMQNKGYRSTVSSYELNNNYIYIEAVIAEYDWSSFVNYINFAFNVSETEQDILQGLNVLPETKVEFIYDENGVRKCVVKADLVTANLNTRVNINMYYRKNEVVVNGVTQTANTLVFECVDNFLHPTFVSTERNLSVSTSIIPSTFQNLYTEPKTINSNSINPRPSGFTTTLGNFVYAYDSDENYVNNFLKRDRDYTIKPYFSLNPAALQLNNEYVITKEATLVLNSTTVYIADTTDIKVNQTVIGDGIPINTKVLSVSPTTITISNAVTILGLSTLTFILNNSKWAYKIEFFNTSSDITDNSKEYVFSSPWMSYNGNLSAPSKIFNNTRTAISLGNEDPDTNHYKGAKFVVFVVPKSTVLNTTSSTNVNTAGVSVTTEPAKAVNSTTQFSLEGSSITTFQNIYDNWKTKLDNIINLSTLRNAIKEIGVSANFHVYNLSTSATTGDLKTFDDSLQSLSDSLVERHDITTTEDSESYESLFLSSDELLEYIATNSIFKTNYTLAFKLLPFASKNEDSFTADKTDFTSNSGFGIRVPYYHTAVPDDSLKLPINTIVQVVNTNLPEHRYVYKQASSTSTMSYTLESTTGNVPSTQFVKNAYYFDLRTTKYYRWDNDTGYSGSLTSVDNPTIETFSYSWFYAAINNWVTDLNRPDYIVKANINIDNNFYFYKEIGDTISLESSLEEIKKYNVLVKTFVSAYQFGNQTPRFLNTIPGAQNYYVQGTIIHSRTNNTVYEQIGTSPYNNLGNTWQSLGVARESLGGAIIDLNSYPVFENNSVFKDTRTNSTYRWYNASATSGSFTPFLDVLIDLEDLGFFDKGVTGIFYLKPYNDEDLLNEQGGSLSFEEQETLKVFWGATSFTQSFNYVYTYDDTEVTYIEKTLTTDPENIMTSENQIVFEDSRLLVWNKNVLYISEEGRYYWFKDRNKIEFGEDIVKVLQYKQIILVFTTQHLYAVYRVETTVTTINPATNQLEQNVTGVAWLKQTVLYNLLVSKEYADVIQVFNQMILFYSADGQLYMIRPSTTIDDQTRFTIQFFNKAVNDVLQNYHEYMNERLAMYASDIRVTKEQVKIKALVSLSYIKMFYYVPGVMTYMLIYDVINNRFTVYDSMTFTNIYDKLFIDSGDLYLTENNGNIFLTMHYVEPNVRDNHVDTAFTNNFKKEGINALIDTGNLNLNNHLNKRFRDLHVVFKNLNSSNLLFNLETHIDDIIAKPFYNEQLEVQEINGALYFINVPKLDNSLIELVDVNQISETATDVLKYSLTNNLFENNNVLMDFSEFSSNKLLTHRTSILGLGKVFRFKMQFVSKGLYKLQHFGIIYKERRI